VLLEELAATLNKKKLVKPIAATGLTVDQILHHYRRLFTMVAAQQLGKQISRDMDDDVVLACALAARADFIVTGDDDLLVLKSFDGIPILSVAQAIKMVSRV
jgi:putative PIN family toxin of toxin-antitoxin system